MQPIPVNRTFDPRRLAWAVFDASILAGVIVTINGLLGLGLRPAGALAMVGAGGVAFALARLPGCWRSTSRARNLIFFPLAMLLLALGVWLAIHRGVPGLTWSRAIYAGAVTLGLGAGFHLIRQVAFHLETDGAEPVRLASLVLGAVWVFHPFLTAQMLGGLDAHWYGHIMVDALQQAHAGVWPVFVGQGEMMFNGAVHPFRTAPYHHHFGIVLDALTLRTLTPLAVQHLTVIATAVWGATLTYLCLTALAPTRRWLAWALALGYISGPAIAGAIYAQEMYMTFMAYGWLPLVVYANIRLTRNNDRAGWLLLATGLALVWICHAPVGAWASLVTLGMQGVRLLARDFDLRSWSLAAGGVAGFGLLTAYYFFSIGELAPANAHGTGALLTYGAGALLALMALVRLLVTGNWRWLALGGVALAILWPTHRMYFGWLGASLALGAALVLIEKWRPRFKLSTRVPEALVFVLLTGGLLAALVFPERDGARLIRSGQAYLLMTQLFPKNLQSVSWLAQELGDLQPGYAMLAALGAGLLAMLVRPTWEGKLVTLAGCGLALMIFPVPRITLLFYQAVPDPLYGICTVSLWLRLMPVLVTLAIFAGFLAMAAMPRGFWPRLAIAVGAAELLFAHWAETSKFIRLGARAVNTSERTAMFYRTENVQLFSYAYNGLPHPAYMLNGVVDYHLESRLLDVAKREWRKDPVLENGFSAPVALTAEPGNEGVAWSWFSPRLTVAAGERRLVKFDFFDRAFSGTLVMKAPGIYRDYYLPDAGFYAKSFGSAPEKPKLLSVWNTSEAERQVLLAFVTANPEEIGKPLGDFARVSMRPYRTEELQIQTRRLTPYRADVELTEPMYLETPRVFIPGYRARVDGISRKVEVSPDHLAMVRVEPGHHTVDLFYTGTFAARMMLRVSALGWVLLAAFGIWQLRGRLKAWPEGRAGYP